MKLGDIPLRLFVPGLRIFNHERTRRGTLRFTPVQSIGWLIEWDGGGRSVLGSLDPEDIRWQALDAVTCLDQLVLAQGSMLSDSTKFVVEAP